MGLKLYDANDIYNDLQSLETNACAHYYVGHDKKNDYALVFGYDEEEVLRGKVAFQPKNSIMQCDYEVDWNMPYNEETGDVDDTAVIIINEEDIEWLFEQWERIKEERELC